VWLRIKRTRVQIQSSRFDWTKKFIGCEIEAIWCLISTFVTRGDQGSISFDSE
jgi:hypothetical protein